MATLKTDYVNDVLNTDVNEERTYNLVDANGNIIYEGVKIRETTALSTVGDNYGAVDINNTNEQVNKSFATTDAESTTISGTDYVPMSDANGNKKKTLWSIIEDLFVKKSGDTMTGNLYVKRTGALIQCEDMNNNTSRRKVWMGFANSGNFYIWDGTNNKSLLSSGVSANELTTSLPFIGNSSITTKGELNITKTDTRAVMNMRTSTYSGFVHVSNAEIAMSVFRGGNFEQQLNYMSVREGYTETPQQLWVNGIKNNGGWMDWWFNNVQKGSIYANTNDADFYIRDNVAGGGIHINCANNIRLESDNGTLVVGRNGTWQNIAAAAFNVNSSRKVKENIKDITENEAKKILDVEVVSFDYIEKVGGAKDNYGVIAEDVEKIIPSVVTVPKDYDETSDDYLNTPSVDYSKFVPFLIKMVQMQQAEIEDLKSKIK